MLVFLKRLSAPLTRESAALALIILASIYASSQAVASATSQDCSLTLTLRQLRLHPPMQTSMIKDWSDYQAAIYAEEKALAERIFERYQAGQLSPEFFGSCLGEEDSTDLSSILPKVFFDASVAHLEVSKSITIQRFVAAIKEKQSRQNFVLMRLVGHLPKDLAPSNLPGGFHRGQQSIFINFAKIPPNEWLLIFSHEILHSLDARLTQAVIDYGAIADIVSITKEFSSTQNLTSEQETAIQKWINAGLDRGLLAEYRAWTLSFKIYQHGVKEKLWHPIVWVDRILQGQRADEPLAHYVLRFLDTRFTDPTDYPFSAAPVKDEFLKVRNNLRSQKSLPDLANLGDFMGGTISEQ